MRLAYVALTRACHRCTVIVDETKALGSTAMAWLLLAADEQGAADPLTATKVAVDRAKGNVAQQIEACLQSPDVDVIEAPDEVSPDDATVLVEDGSAVAMQVVPVTRRLARTGRTASFSSLVAAGPRGADFEHDRDGGTGRASQSGDDDSGTTIPLAGFPGGAAVGTLLHGILEAWDFAGPADARAAVATEHLQHAGHSPVAINRVIAALEGVLETPMSVNGETLRLAEVCSKRRFDEMQFLLPVHPGGAATPFSPASFAATLERHATRPVIRAAAERASRLAFSDLEGYLTGFIDCVFHHGDRWYLVDWKSNFLGMAAESYDQAGVEQAMLHHDYALQYHLYCVALDRWLRRFDPQFDWDRDFGGVLYVFLRGVAPAHEPGCGVFVDRPSAAMVRGLGAHFEAGGDGADGAAGASAGGSQ